jgi:hypothetical protein
MSPGRIGKHWRNKCGLAEIRMAGKYIPNMKIFLGDARDEFSTSKAKLEGRYTPGGTATAALGAWTHRVVDAG